MRKVITAVVDDGDVLRDEAGVGAATSSPGSPGSAAQPVGIVGEPADGARRRARRERGRQGGALRVAVRRVRHPARVPARRARASSSARRSRSRASSATAPRCCSRCPRRRCRRSSSCCARATAPGYFVMNGTRVRGRLHRRLADGRDRGDGPRRHGRTSSSARRSRRCPRARSATPKRIELAEEIRKNIDPYIAAGPRAGRRRHRPRRDPPRDLAGPAGLADQARRPPLAQARRAARLT